MIVMHTIDSLLLVTKYVLVLLPTDSNQLLAQWQGPYPIIQKIGPVDYCVDMYDHRKHKRVFHINMLKKWYPAPQSGGVNLAEQADEDSLDEDFPSWQPAIDTLGAPTLGKQLTRPQQNDLSDLMRKFVDVFSIKPGKTELIEHHIETYQTTTIQSTTSFSGNAQKRTQRNVEPRN